MPHRRSYVIVLTALRNGRPTKTGMSEKASAIKRGPPQLKRLVLDNGYQIDGPANLYQAPAVRCPDGWLIQTEKLMWFISETPS